MTTERPCPAGGWAAASGIGLARGKSAEKQSQPAGESTPLLSRLYMSW